LSQYWLIFFNPFLWSSLLDFVRISFARREFELKLEWI